MEPKQQAPADAYYDDDINDADIDLSFLNEDEEPSDKK